MTDEEILKAFQLCNTDTDCDTNGCPYNDMVEDCISMLNNDIISRFNELKAENASLRERLDKAIELPCKIGDEVYEVHGKCDRKNCVYNGYYGQWRCDYGGKTNCNPFITVNKFRYCDIPMVGKTIFVTKEAAEARLAELKGEKE